MVEADVDHRDGEPAPRGDPDTITYSLARRLHFLWLIAVGILMTIPYSLIQLVSHQFDASARNFGRWARQWSRAILGLSGIRTAFTQMQALDSGRPYVFVSNHQNLLDILTLAAAMPYPFGFVAKAELARVPFLGFAIRNSASVFIDRTDRRKAVESLRLAGERIRGGNSVLLFAEGSRSYGRSLLPFKKGAFTIALEAGIAIVPVALVDAYRLADERRYLSRPGTVRIVSGVPIDVSGKKRSEIPELMEEVRQQISALIAV